MLPPANASELVGQDWQGPSAFEFHCEQCSIAFQPFDSFQKLQCSPDGNCTLLPTAPGDYVVYGEDGFQTMRSMPSGDQWPLLFEDGFQGCPIVDTCSDRFENVYTPLVSVGSCTLNRNAKFIATAPAGGNTSNACGLVTSRPAFGFFAEPARHAWTNMSVNATGTTASGAMRAALLGMAAGIGPEDVADILLASGPQAAAAFAGAVLPTRSPAAGASPVAAVGVDLTVSDAGGSVQLWARTSATAPLRTLHSWQLPASCVAGRVASLDSLDLSLDWSTATVELACGGKPLAAFSGASGLVWSEWGSTLATSRVAMAAVSFAEMAGLAGAGRSSGPVSIQVDHWTASTLLPRGVLPAVLGPFPGGPPVDSQLPSLGNAHRENERLRGVLDVTLPPFSADPTGKRDATLALTLAVAWAREHGLVAYLPIGNYSVTSTLELHQFGRILPGTTVDAAGTLSAQVPGGAAPASLRGEVDPTRPGERATIELAPNSPGFGDAAAPRAVLNVSFAGTGGDTVGRTRNQVVSSIRVAVSAGNPGAVGVRLLGGAGSGLEDVIVAAGDGLIGVSGLSGEGGATAGLTVDGGVWGVDARRAPSQSTVSGLVLTGQRCGAVIVNGRQSTTIVGATISRSAESDGAKAGIPALTQGCSPAAAVRSLNARRRSSPAHSRHSSSGLCPDPVGFDECDDEAPASGQLTIVDSQLDIGSASHGLRGAALAPAVWTRRSVVLSGVWVRGEGPALVARTQADNASHPLLWSLPAAAADKWLVAERVVVPVEPPAATWGAGASVQAWQPLPARLASQGGAWNASWLPLAEVGSNAGQPPADLVGRHGWGGAAAFPSFEWPGAVLAKQAGPAGRPAAAGDGITDDSAALQAAIDEACPAGGGGSGVVVLGRGVFVLSRGLVVPGGCALLGAAAFSTELVALPSASPRPQWLVTASAGARSVGSLPQLSLPTTVAMLQARVWAASGDQTSALLVRMTAAAAALPRASGSPEAGFQSRQASAEIQPQCGQGGAVVSLPGGGACPVAKPSSGSLVELRGSGGDSTWHARLFTLGLSSGGMEQGAAFRGLLVSEVGPSSSLAVYHTHVVGLVSDAGVEARACGGKVDLFGLAASGRFAALLVSAPPAGSRFAMWGFGGSACPLARNESYPPGFSQATPSLFRVARQTSGAGMGAVSLYSTMDAGSTSTVAPAGSEHGPGCPLPDDVATVVAVPASGTDLASGPGFRPPLAEL